MLEESQLFHEFQRLWDIFPDCCRTADELVSPNSEDDEFIRIAIVGFSCHDMTENWCHGQFLVAKRYLTESEELDDSRDIKRRPSLLTELETRYKNST